MLTYLLQRLVAMVGVLFGISIIVFALVVAAPGDPAAILLEIENGGVTPTDAEVALFRTQLGLDAPAPQRYLTWVGQALMGDLGRSYRSRQPIVTELAARLPATLQLTGVSLVLAIGIGLPLGIGSALWRNRWFDLLVRLLVLLGGPFPVMYWRCCSFCSLRSNWGGCQPLAVVAPATSSYQTWPCQAGPSRN
jgi:ABC-type dipeptide/oligopeptide/nickel transport system permease component